jgi:hypothetical protein
VAPFFSAAKSKKAEGAERHQALLEEMSELSILLRSETRTRARWVILQRMNEIISQMTSGVDS